MTWISKLTTAFGLVLLAHSCYSAQEFSTFQSYRSTGASQIATPALPIDITIETIAALLISSLGLVLGTQQLKPIQWHMWAGEIEREGAGSDKNADGEPSRGYTGNPFRYLETRPGFVDIRRQRKTFGDWVRDGSSARYGEDFTPGDAVDDRDATVEAEGVYMALEMKADGTIGCAYFVAASSTLYLYEDIRIASLEVIESILFQAQPTCILVPSSSPEKLMDFLSNLSCWISDDERNPNEENGFVLRSIVSSDFNPDYGRQVLAMSERTDIGQNQSAYFTTAVEELEDYVISGNSRPQQGSAASKQNKTMLLGTLVNLEGQASALLDIDDEAIILVNEILTETIDFQASMESGRGVVARGVSPELDALKSAYGRLQSRLESVCQEHKSRLSDEAQGDIVGCVFHPQRGYLLVAAAILQERTNYGSKNHSSDIEFSVNAREDALLEDGLVYFKTSGLRAVDGEFGDLAGNIIAHPYLSVLFVPR
ncbi:hypothetical protein SEPCBS57363_006607 [Sporothrix epigloea]|uniref:Uncharacterized protein n=1 Tax=Sporothrix epigloea TaxID=1892477 RepID=A0ABP0E5V2_9PEZI